MLRLIYPILLAFALNASILPDKIGEYQKTAPAEVELADKAVWTEYGLQESERAAYGPLRITAYRFGDSTGAEAGSQWLQGEKASGTMLLLRGNYVVVIEGPAPH